MTKGTEKELNKNGVKFSVMKDETGNHSVFFQAKDTTVMEKTFRNTLATVEKKEAKKDSVIQSIDKYKQAMKDTVTKDKVKNKQKEQKSMRENQMKQFQNQHFGSSLS